MYLESEVQQILTHLIILPHLLSMNNVSHVLSSAELNKLKSEGLESIAMTTNGVTLSKRLAALKEAGLDQINISLDTLIAPKFELVTRRKGWQRVIQGMDDALDMGYSPVKVGVDLLKPRTFGC